VREKMAELEEEQLGIPKYNRLRSKSNQFSHFISDHLGNFDININHSLCHSLWVLFKKNTWRKHLYINYHYIQKQQIKKPGWWFFTTHLKNMLLCSSNWAPSAPNRNENNYKKMSCHHLENYLGTFFGITSGLLKFPPMEPRLHHGEWPALVLVPQKIRTNGSAASLMAQQTRVSFV